MFEPDPSIPVFQPWRCHRVARTTRWNWWRTQPVTRSPVPASRPVTRPGGDCCFQQPTVLPFVQHHQAAPAPTRASISSSLLSRPAGQSVTGPPSQWTRQMKRRTALCSRGPLSSVEWTHRPTTRGVSVGWILLVSAAVFSFCFLYRLFDLLLHSLCH